MNTMHVFNSSDTVYLFLPLLPRFELMQQYVEQEFLYRNNVILWYSVTR
jgi:hypothetical protein